MKISNIMIDDTQAVRMYVDDQMVWEKEEGLLPRGYTECEYLESTGTQYIDTLVVYDNTINVDFTYQFISYIGNWNALLGGMANFEDGNWLLVAQSTYNRGVRISYGSKSNECYYFDYGNFSDFKIRNVKIDNQVIYYDNEYFIKVDSPFSTMFSLALFANHKASQNNYIEKSPGRVYSLRLYTDDYNILNFIPSLDLSGRPCMYDTVSKQPFYNKGTGEFLYKIKEV